MSNDNVILHVADDAPKDIINNSIHNADIKGHQLESCCFSRSTDKRLYILVVQTILSFVIVIFSVLMLTDKNINCERSSLFSSLISLILGYWVPSPLKS